MIRFGARAQDMRPMPSSDLFILRLKLLIIMAKAYLKGNPLGNYRKKAIIETANFVFYEALFQTSRLQPPDRMSKPKMTAQSHSKDIDHLFLQRVQLLSVMANAFAKGKSQGNYRKQAMAENIDLICDHLSENVSLVDAKFLKVA